MTRKKFNQDDELENQNNQQDSSVSASLANCPFHREKNATEEIRLSGQPMLMRVSEVMQKYAEDSAMQLTLQWVKNFLAKPHPEVGRKGPVCPFVPISLELDSIWMAEITDSDLSYEKIVEIITNFRDLFLQTLPLNGPDAMNKAFMVVFPNLGVDGAAIVDKVQYALKRYFVDMGLMLGEFHANNESPGLRNPEFRPLRSPIPMLAIRHMVDSDLPFLLKAVYPAGERAAFLRSYLQCLGNSVSSGKFDQALDGVIQAEIQKWVAQNLDGDVRKVELAVDKQNSAGINS